MPITCGSKRIISVATSGGHYHKKGRKDNGVDISDTSPYYSPDECNKLSSATRYKLISDPKRIVARYKRATGDNRIFTNVRSSSVTATAKYEKERA